MPDGRISITNFQGACFTPTRGVGEGFPCRKGLTDVDADAFNLNSPSDREALSPGNRYSGTAAVIRCTEGKAEIAAQFAGTRIGAPAKKTRQAWAPMRGYSLGVRHPDRGPNLILCAGSRG